MSDVLIIWEECLKYLNTEINNVKKYNTWILPLHAVVNNDFLQILAPNTYVLEFIKENYLQKIKDF